MTMRTNTLDAGRRSQTSSSRCTIRECDDDHDMMQIKQGDVMQSETHSDFERWQSVGFTTMPKKQQSGQQGSQSGGQSGMGGGGGGGGGGSAGDGVSGFNNNQPKDPSAEGVVIYANGSRSHAICMGIDDRRVRPYGMKEGESAHYAADGSGQMTYHRLRGDSNDGLYVLTCDQQQQQGSDTERVPIDLVTYNGLVFDQHGRRVLNRDGSQQQSSTRFVSIRHVNKQKQQRKSQKLNSGGGGQSGGGGGGGSLQARDVLDVRSDAWAVNPWADGGSGGGGSGSGGGSSSSNYKHEGDSVNTEMRLDKTKIQFFDQGGGSSEFAASQAQPVGLYDKQSKKWNFNSGQTTQSMQADQNHIHILFGGNAVWVDGSGCWSSKPIQIKGDPGFMREDYDGTPESYARVMGYDNPQII